MARLLDRSRHLRISVGQRPTPTIATLSRAKISWQVLRMCSAGTNVGLAVSFAAIEPLPSEKWPTALRPSATALTRLPCPRQHSPAFKRAARPLADADRLPLGTQNLRDSVNRPAGQHSAMCLRRVLASPHTLDSALRGPCLPRHRRNRERAHHRSHPPVERRIPRSWVGVAASCPTHGRCERG